VVRQATAASGVVSGDKLRSHRRRAHQDVWELPAATQQVRARGYPHRHGRGRRDALHAIARCIAEVWGNRGQTSMNEKEELAHLRTPSADPKQGMIDYWGQRAEKAEAKAERLQEMWTAQQRLNMQAMDEIKRLRAEAALWEERTKQGAEIISGNVD